MLPPYSTPAALAHAIEAVNIIMWSQNQEARVYLGQYAKHILGMYQSM